MARRKSGKNLTEKLRERLEGKFDGKSRRKIEGKATAI